MGDTQDIARFEALAEEAISAIYDMRGVNVKDCFDDALYNLGRAIDIAAMRGFEPEVKRLKLRREHIRAMYQTKFRKSWKP